LRPVSAAPERFNIPCQSGYGQCSFLLIDIFLNELDSSPEPCYMLVQTETLESEDW